MIKYYSGESFKDLNGIYIIDFYADWCGPCKMLGRVLEDIDVDIIKVDVDKHEDLAKEYRVMSIPKLLFIKDGEIKSEMLGFRSKDDILRELDSLK